MLGLVPAVAAFFGAAARGAPRHAVHRPAGRGASARWAGRRAARPRVLVVRGRHRRHRRAQPRRELLAGLQGGAALARHPPGRPQPHLPRDPRAGCGTRPMSFVLPPSGRSSALSRRSRVAALALAAAGEHRPPDDEQQQHQRAQASSRINHMSTSFVARSARRRGDSRRARRLRLSLPPPTAAAAPPTRAAARPRRRPPPAPAAPHRARRARAGCRSTGPSCPAGRPTARAKLWPALLRGCDRPRRAGQRCASARARLHAGRATPTRAPGCSSGCSPTASKSPDGAPRA